MAETEDEKKAREAKEAEEEAERKEKLRLAEEAMHKRNRPGFPW